MNTLLKIYSDSFFNRCLETLMAWFHESFFYKILDRISTFLQNQYQESLFKRFFLSRSSFLSDWFKGGFIDTFISTCFLWFQSIMRVGLLAYNDSYLQIFIQHTTKDLTQNWLRYGSTFLYSSLIFYTFLTLFLGSGFTRKEMMILILVVFFLFFLSQLQGDSNKYLENSVLIKWIQKIYL